MEYLPVRSNGQKVYAGFWKRFCAGIVDILIILPLSFLFTWMEGFDRTLAILITIPSSLLFAMFNVYFNARFGGTPGKLVVGIRIATPDGSPIGWAEAWKRSSVDLVFAFSLLMARVWGLAQVESEGYASLGWIERERLVLAGAPAWYGTVRTLLQVWFWSEVVVLLFNKRRRAIHDFIAGTVVIKKTFAKRTRGHVRK